MEIFSNQTTFRQEAHEKNRDNLYLYDKFKLDDNVTDADPITPRDL